ncbi:MAG: indole-3-glycerol phosphate synthase TrpC [Prevotella sp.]
MQDILTEIIAHKRIEVEHFKAQISERKIHADVEKVIETRQPSLRKALQQSETGIIAEFKRRSPSKGWIKEEGSADIIPLSYQHNGAAAISILTDKDYFGGDDTFISAAREAGVTLPVLYKNFIVDEYQLFQARLCGASAVLLIAAVLPKPECRNLIQMTHELGMEVLLEMHSEEETDYADLEADVLGINNRNLGSFVTDVNNSLRLSLRLPDDACKVSESGISNAKTICSLLQAGFNGFLIGENFMKTDNPGLALKEFCAEVTAMKTGVVM